MKVVYSFLIFMAAFILQTTVMNSFAILGTAPNLILCLVIVFCFLYDRAENFVWAILFGLMQDAYFSEVMGAFALCYFLIALGIFFIKEFLNPENLISVIGLAAVTTFLCSTMYFGISAVFGSDNHIIRMLEIQPVLIVYNTVIAVILQRLFIRKVIKHRNDKKFKGRFISYE